LLGDAGVPFGAVLSGCSYMMYSSFFQGYIVGRGAVFL